MFDAEHEENMSCQHSSLLKRRRRPPRLITSKSRALVDGISFLVCAGGAEAAVSCRAFLNSAFQGN